MVLDNLGSSLKDAVKKLVNAGKIDKEVIDDVVKDIQRAMIQSDVNVRLVMKLSSQIKNRALTEAPPAGMDSREHVLRIVYTELVNIVGKATPIELKPQTIMMVGLQGSGKTTTTAKLAKYFARKGLKPAVICADTYRPGAYDQLSQLCEKLGVAFYGERDNKDAVAIVRNGLKEIAKYDVKIVDTAGRHALETDLIQEMKDISTLTNYDHRFLVLDAAIGQQASEQAKAFNDAVGITGVVITKLDGTAKGGGALSAVSDTNTSIAFIGVGETPEDLERFDPDGFISRLLGMGDLKALVEKANEMLTPGRRERRQHDGGQVHAERHVLAAGGDQQDGPAEADHVHAAARRNGREHLRRRVQDDPGQAEELQIHHGLDDRFRKGRPEDHRQQPHQPYRHRLGQNCRRCP